MADFRVGACRSATARRGRECLVDYDLPAGGEIIYLGDKMYKHLISVTDSGIEPDLQ